MLEEFEQNEEVRVGFLGNYESISNCESLREFPERTRSYRVINTPHITLSGSAVSPGKDLEIKLGKVPTWHTYKDTFFPLYATITKFRDYISLK